MSTVSDRVDGPNRDVGAKVTGRRRVTVRQGAAGKPAAESTRAVAVDVEEAGTCVVGG